MTLFICPRCQMRVAVSSNTGDFVHECNSGQTVYDEEDKVVMTTEVDEFGNANIDTGKLPGDIMQQGQSNKLFGRRGWVEGDKNQDYTSRGAPSDITRQRQHYEYIENPKSLDRRGK